MGREMGNEVGSDVGFCSGFGVVSMILECDCVRRWGW